MNTTAPESDSGTTAGTTPPDARPGRVLYRTLDDRMLAGVASGLARYFGTDPMLVRIAIVVLCFVGGIGLPLYLAGWLLIPEEGAEQSIAADMLRSTGWRN
jgi:phage shock protein PspC (stress-responsive transcriptional regulator)